ncbi:MAG: MBL fold metallo-hydrolase [Spirochaetaceae bacterium]|jgi:glyoxylase-like metal-dependent hydrolase (beta-lactamase superfamily II)|nr:MBL fold metallo-hydrolase [Spirochaetaceae bacterium]
MKVFFHYCHQGFSNCYILGTEFDEETGGTGPRNAIIIDPGVMDEAVLNSIEQYDYTLRGVFITHNHPSHVRGLRAIKRIYEVDIYAVNHVILDQRTVMVRDGETVTVGDFKIEVISVPGHSADSAVFKIEHLLFTGDTLSAGLVGSTASSYGAEVQMRALRSRLLSLPGDYVVMPGHGPPSSLDAERRFNVGIQHFEQHKKNRPTFNLELLE